MTLNAEQQRAVDTHNGFICVMATAGSGKTRVIVERMRAIRALYPTKRFLSLTFTKEAALEMNKRFGKEVADEKIFSTFHSWALRFVTAEAASFASLGHNLRHFPLALPYEAAKELGRIVRHNPAFHGKKEAFNDAQTFISKCKRMGISPQQARYAAKHELEEEYALTYRKYDEALRAKGVMDFDSCICETAKLLEKRTDVRERWQYDYLQLDEAQDTDVVQWRIVELINKGNVFAVGDENQGMYSWRGSEDNLAARFVQRFSPAKLLPLSVNYRSTPEIVLYCKEIAPLKNESIENSTTPNASGTPPEFRRYNLDFQEAKGIVNSITDLGHTAILVRTNHLLRAFEDECSERGLRYKLLGKSGFWSQGEVKDVMAFVQLMVAPTDAATVRVLKSPYDCTRFMRKGEIVERLQQMQSGALDTIRGKVPLHRLLASYNSQDSGQDDLVHQLAYFLNSLKNDIAGKPAGEAVKRIVERVGILYYYDDDEDSAGIDNNPIENVLEVIKVAGTKGSFGDFLAYVHKVHRAQLAHKNYLTLSTIHQAKGKEWDYTYVAAVNDGALPHTKGDEEEEKRIYFVACSRAAKRLVVSCHGIPSRYIADKVPEEAEGTSPAIEFTLVGQKVK